MNIKVIKAEKHHLLVLCDILNKATEKLLAKGIMQWEYPWDEEEILSYIEKREFYMAFAGGNPVGCVGIKDFENNIFNPGDTKGAYMYHLATNPDFAGLGIGGKVCTWLKQWREENHRTIYFDCWRGNDMLIDFYKTNGFVSLGEFPEEDYFIHAFRTKQEV